MSRVLFVCATKSVMKRWNNHGGKRKKTTNRTQANGGVTLSQTVSIYLLLP